MAKIITIANQKGGVGKTTTALCVGSVLEDKGYKVLYVDLDKQCNTTTTLNADTQKGGTYDILANKTSAKELVQETANKKYVISASDKLDIIDSILNDNKNSLGKEYRLKNSLKDVSDYFDFIVIDTPPNLNNATINALTSTDYLVVVCNADTYSMDGTKYLFNICKDVKEYTNPNLKIGGIAITRYSDRAVINRDLKDMLNELATANDTKVYNSFIRECIKIKESQALKEDFVSYAKSSNGYTDYLALTEEILNDLNKQKESKQYGKERF